MRVGAIRRCPGVGLVMKFRLPAHRLISFGCLLAVTLVALTADLAEAQESDPSSGTEQSLPYEDAEAQAIDRMLMCPICPGVNIEQSQVELARQMQQVVRDMLDQGATREEILDFFVERYGPGVLAAPPKSGFNLVAWVVPVVVVVAALGAAFLVLRSMVARRRPEPVMETPLDDDLRPYLAVIDQELGLSQNPDATPVAPSASQAQEGGTSSNG